MTTKPDLADFSDLEMEQLIREYVRLAAKALQSINGVSEHSIILQFIFSDKGGKWSVQAGSRYPYQNVQSELLTLAVQEVEHRMNFEANAKFNLLAGPEAD